MNILLVAFACEPHSGSEEGVGWNWAVNLSRKHYVYVITRGQEKQYIENEIKKNPIMNLEFFYFEDENLMHFIDKKLPMGFRIYYRWWQTQIVKIAENIVANNKIDIIHQLTYNEYRTPGKLYDIDIPFVWGPIGGGHRYNPVLRKGYFRKTDIIKEIIRNHINDYYLLNKNVLAAIEKAAEIIVADPATYAILPKTRAYIKMLEVAYYPCRNTIKEFKWEGSRKIRLMYAGVLVPRKGIKIIIDALAESEFREFEFIIIGDGCDKKHLEKLVKKHKMEDYIKFLGKKKYDEVNKYYDWTDLFLFPSIRDTSGNVVLEAMSHGVPVIALNHNGASEMITSDTGDLIQIINYSQIKKDYVTAIKKYYYKRELLIEKGVRARKRMEMMYSWDCVMDEIDKVYHKVARGGAKANRENLNIYIFCIHTSSDWRYVA